MGDRVIVVPFKKEHIEPLIDLPQLSFIRKFMTDERIAVHENNGFSFTAISEDGAVLAVAGVMPMWENVAESWAIFAPNIKKYFLSIHKVVSTYLNNISFKRVQMTVDFNFKEGHRWARLLGFKLEAGRLCAYLPDGRDVSMYARIK